METLQDLSFEVIHALGVLASPAHLSAIERLAGGLALVLELGGLLAIRGLTRRAEWTEAAAVEYDEAA